MGDLVQNTYIIHSHRERERDIYIYIEREIGRERESHQRDGISSEKDTLGNQELLMAEAGKIKAEALLQEGCTLELCGVDFSQLKADIWRSNVQVTSRRFAWYLRHG